MKQGVAVLGAGGYTGRELLRLLGHHPHLQALHITSDHYAGRLLPEVFPEYSDTQLRFQKHAAPLPKGLPVFLASPNELSLAQVPRLLEQGHRLVDLSGAFRLHSKAVWESAYGLEHRAFDCITDKKIIYGLPELFRDSIQNARAVANPGCYPTGAIVPLAALGDLRTGLVSVSIQACSGVSGAGGRVEGGGFAFTHVHENFRAYKVLKHQHEPEIAQYAAHGMPQGLACPLSFTPHLLPLYRGILSTIVLHWDGPAPTSLEQIFQGLAAKETFFRFYREPEEVELARVQNTNYLDLAIRSRDNITVMLSALDNLVKGAAGQAIQNMNLMLGLPEESGLL